MSDDNLLEHYKKMKEREFELSLPYIPGKRSLQTRTISLNAIHYNNSIHLFYHTLLPLLQIQLTYTYLLSINNSSSGSSFPLSSSTSSSSNSSSSSSLFSPPSESFSSSSLSSSPSYSSSNLSISSYSTSLSSSSSSSPFISFSKPSSLPFILTRSSYPGAGKFSIHWSGDNMASFEFLKLSIASFINFGIFGMPFMGSDICGFMGDTNRLLCLR